MTHEHVDALYKADLSDPRMVRELVQALPAGVHGIANVAGLPPTAPAELVLKVNLLGLKAFTLAMIPKLADGASIVNLASLAGFGWANQVSSIVESEDLDFDDVAEFVRTHDAGDDGGRSYFFSKEALVAWTMRHRWTWRDRGIRMNAVSPGPVDTPILKDFIETLGARAEEDMRVMDRPGTAADIAPVVAFLLSDLSGWIRGTNIPVDGGMSSHLLCNLHGL
jgi:NAD(P)-dependent dehydrogenase (short-subunit alcohol dehydrogenase family)